MDLKIFDYHLPEKYIAQKPSHPRDKSKLLILDRRSSKIVHDVFYNLVNYVRSGDIIVINESKVTKCRLFGIKEGTKAKIECLALRKIDNRQYLVLVKPSKRLKTSTKVFIDKKYYFTVKSKLSYGEAVVEFNTSPEIIFKQYGKVPLPPYIKSEDINEKYYQTIYAKKEGSVAAPTAGLHFTENLMKKLEQKGVVFARVVLDIGLGTFRPIKVEKVENHRMHKEYYYVSKAEAEKINNAKKSGGRIIAVGTTTSRVLETIMTRHGKLVGDSGFTDLYIYPGYKFKIIDCLITNFHLPRSTLLVMVSAFGGIENVLNAYEEAKRCGYRFYSFGDCMLIK